MISMFWKAWKNHGFSEKSRGRGGERGSKLRSSFVFSVRFFLLVVNTDTIYSKVAKRRSKIAKMRTFKNEKESIFVIDC